MMPLTTTIAMSGKLAPARSEAPAPAASAGQMVLAAFTLPGLDQLPGVQADGGDAEPGEAAQADHRYDGNPLLMAMASMTPFMPVTDVAAKHEAPAGDLPLAHGVGQLAQLAGQVNPLAGVAIGLTSSALQQLAGPQAGQPAAAMQSQLADQVAMQAVIPATYPTDTPARVASAGADGRIARMAGMVATLAGVTVADEGRERQGGVPGTPQLHVGAAPADGLRTASVSKPQAAPAAPAGQQLLAALGERINIQTRHGIENTTIRLDPPMLGSIEIAIRREGGALQVRLSASHADVVQQLHGISDTLRQDLGGRQYTQVAVTVADGGKGSDRQDGQAPREDGSRQPLPGRALAEAGDDERDAAFRLG